MPENKENIEFSDHLFNPLDQVELLMKANNWVFDRVSHEELLVRVQGKNCAYELFFIWHDDMSALQFCCRYNLTINPDNMDTIASSMLTINENLWMGHFDLPVQSRQPRFRHTCLIRGMEKGASSDYIDDMVEMGLTLCEQYYSAFYLLSHANDASDQTLSLALMEAAGEC